MQNILDVHQALRRPITSKINFAEAQILQGKLYEDVKKNDLLVAQKSFDTWTQSTRVQDTLLYPEAGFDVYTKTKLLEFAGQVYAFRGQRGGTDFPTTPQSLGTVFRYDIATDTWTAIFNIPGRFSADRGSAIDAVIYQGTMWFAIGCQDDTARNDSFLSVYFWNGTTFVLQADLNGTPTNGSVAQHVREVSLAVFNDRLFLTTASNQGSPLYGYNGQSWTTINSQHNPDSIDQYISKLIVFNDTLYWVQQANTSTVRLSRYLHNPNPASTTYLFTYNYTSFDVARRMNNMDFVVYNNTVLMVFNMDNHTTIRYTVNMQQFSLMYPTGNWTGRSGEDFKDGLNSQWASRWYLSSDNELYLILGGTADRFQFFKIHDSLENVDFHERYTTQYLGYGPDVGADLYDFDFIEHQGYLLATTGQANNIQRFYRIPLDIGNNNNNLVWTPAFQYTRSDDYEINQDTTPYSWRQQLMRGVAFQVFDGDLYKAASSQYFPFLLSWKLVNNKWQKIADPDALPAGDARQVAMEVHDGELYLAVGNFDSGPRTLTYKWTGTGWTKLIDMSPLDDQNNGIALKSFGNRLYLAITSVDSGNRIRVFDWDGFVWTYRSDLPSRPGNSTRPPSLEVHANQLYLAVAGGNSSFDIYLWRLNADLINWSSLTSNIDNQPTNNTNGVALKAFNGNLYMSCVSNSVSRIWKWNGSSFITMTSPVNWANAATMNTSTNSVENMSQAITFLVYKNRLYLFRRDNQHFPRFRMYSLIDEANGVWKSHKRWRPATERSNGLPDWQFAAVEFGDDAYISYVNGSDNHRPHMEDLNISPPGLVSVFPRADIKSFYGIGIANEDGLINDTINITSLTPDFNLYKNNGWEQMVWQRTG